MADRIHHITRKNLHKRADKLLKTLEVSERIQRIGMKRWIETNLKIRPQHGGIEPFELRPFQRRLVAIVVMMTKWQIPIRLVILKSRKEGISTAMAAICFYRAIKSSHNETILIAHDKKTAKKIFDIHLKFYGYLPEDEKLPLKGRESQTSLAFAPPHYSEIVPYTAGDPNVARGMTPRDVHFSEQAFWPFDQATWTAAESSVPGPSKSRDTMIVSESTACGTGGTFHELWEQAFKPTSWFELYTFLKRIKDNWESEPVAPWIGLFTSWADDDACAIPWNESDGDPDPLEHEYRQAYELSDSQLKWARNTRCNRLLGSWEKFHQEYPCHPDLAFKFSGFPLFNGDVLREQLKAAKDTEPAFKGNIRFDDSLLPKAELAADLFGPLEIWEHPKPGFRYAVGVDVSEGIGSDYSEIVVFNVGTFTQVAHFQHNRMNLTEVSVTAYLLGLCYNWALLGVERNSIGQVVLELLRYGAAEYPQMVEYPNVYYHIAKDRVTQEIQRRPGFQTSSATKQRALTLLQDAIAHNRVRLRSIRLINQLMGFGIDPRATGTRKFTQRHKDPESMLYADDAVMSCAIATTMREEVIQNEGDDITMTVW